MRIVRICWIVLVCLIDIIIGGGIYAYDYVNNLNFSWLIPFCLIIAMGISVSSIYLITKQRNNKHKQIFRNNMRIPAHQEHW